METTQNTTKNCAACSHWKTSSEGGECRRHAPQTIVFEIDQRVSVESRFPVTSANDWCGDFEGK